MSNSMKRLLTITAIVMLVATVGFFTAHAASHSQARANAEAQMENAKFVGADSCKGCHADAHQGWAATVHGDMIQDAKVAMKAEARAMLEYALKNPAEKIPAGKFTSGWKETPTYGDLLKYGPHKDSAKEGSISSLDDIKYTVGGKWKQRYVVQTDDGHVFLRFQYYWTTEDGKDNNPRVHTYGETRSYEDRCLACHSTGYDYDLSNKIDRTVASGYQLTDVVADLGVSCEACHGPGSAHIANISKDREAGLANIINPAEFTNQQQLDACGACHARNNKWHENTYRNDTPKFLIGDNLDELVEIARIEHTPKRFHDDGVGSSHRMEYNDMEQGPKAGMTCTTCHNVHKENTLKMEFSALCASCHGPDHGYDIDKVMPKRAKSSNIPDIRTHTFILDENGNAVGNPDFKASAKK
ncbi:MAG: multiheme c-type cytochrome [Pelovirga sp.]